MIARKTLLIVALVVGGTSAALAQSAYTTGTAGDMAKEGYPTSYGSDAYAYGPGFRSQASTGVRDDDARGEPYTDNTEQQPSDNTEQQSPR